MVLCIDDEPEICELLQEIIQDVGIACRTAYDTKSALKSLKEHMPKVILCDVSMPGQSGLDFVRSICESSLPAAIVMLTAHMETDRVEHAYSLGVVDYLIKPFQSERLQRSLPHWMRLGEQIQQIKAKVEKLTDVLHMQKDLVKQFRIARPAPAP